MIGCDAGHHETDRVVLHGRIAHNAAVRKLIQDELYLRAQAAGQSVVVRIPHQFDEKEAEEQRTDKLKSTILVRDNAEVGTLLLAWEFQIDIRIIGDIAHLLALKHLQFAAKADDNAGANRLTGLHEDREGGISTLICILTGLIFIQLAKPEIILRCSRGLRRRKLMGSTSSILIGHLYTPEYVTTHFAVVLKQNNLRKLRFHDLRHTCASLLVAEGVDMFLIQHWLGHANYSTTADVYSHLSSGAQTVTADAIVNALK